MSKKYPYMFGSLANVRMKWLLAAVFFISLVSFSIFSPFIGQGSKVSAYSVIDAKYDIKQYAVYNAMISCVKTSDTSDRSEGLGEDWTIPKKASLGYITSGDVGLQSCSSVYEIWRNIVGFANNQEFFEAMDWEATTSNFCQGNLSYNKDLTPMTGNSCPDGSKKVTVTTWSPKGTIGLRTDLLSKITSLSSAAGMPTREPLGTRYLEAIAGLADVCGASFTSSASGVPILGDDGQTISYKSVSMSVENETKQVYPYPGLNVDVFGEGWTYCSKLAADATKAFTEIQSQIEKDMIAAGTDVYADGYGETTGFCDGKSKVQTAVQKADGEPSDYTACRNAVAKCLQPKTTTMPSGTTTTQFTDFTADSLARCIMKITGKNYETTLKAVLALQPAANAAAVGSASSTNPCATDPNGNDINGKPCSNALTNPGADPCEVIPAGTPSPWLACSIYTAVSTLVGVLSNTMEKILYSDTSAIFNENMRTISNNFRNIAMVLIILAGLAMIISQATGMDFVDAYTVKKVLPKLAIAVVGIALSWPLLKFAVTLSNDLGAVVSNLMNIVSSSGIAGEDSSVGTDIGAIFGTITVAGGVMATLGIWGALLLIVSLVISFLAGLVVLLLQKMLLIVLIIVAPLAIAAYVLPGTEKLWKMWKSNFIKIILMYFIIMMLVKSGDVVGAALFSTTTTTGWLLGVLAKIATLTLTLKAPQLASNMMGGIAGMISNGTYKMAGGFKAPVDNMRKKNTQNRNQQMLAGTRFSESDGVLGGASRRLNTLGRGLKQVATPNAIGLDPRQWRSNMRNALNDDAHDAAGKFAKENAAFSAISGDDAKLHAARYRNISEIETELAARDNGRFGEGHERERRDAANQILRAQKETNLATFNKARVRAQAGTGTGYQDATGAFDANMMLDDIMQAYGTDTNGAERALAEMRGALTNSGQIAGQAGFGDWDAALRMRMGAAGSSAETRFMAQRRVMGSAIDSAPPQYAFHGKPSSAAAMANEHFERINALQDSMLSQTPSIEERYVDDNGVAQTRLRAATQDDVDAALANAHGILDSLTQASPQNANAFANGLFGNTLNDSNGGNLSVRDYMDRRENSEQYRYRRAYSRNTMLQGEDTNRIGGNVGRPGNNVNSPTH